MTRYDSLAITDYLRSLLSDELSNQFISITNTSHGNFFTPDVAVVQQKPQIAYSNIGVPESEDEGDSGSNAGDLVEDFSSEIKDPDSDLFRRKIEALKKIESLAKLGTNDPSVDDNQYKIAAKFFAPYVDKHWELVRLYSVLRKHFRDDLKSESARQSKEFIQRVGDLLILSSILKGVHRHGLNVPRGTRMYLGEQQLLKGYLSGVAGIDMSEIELDKESPGPEWGTQSIRDLHQRWNLIPRLFLVRLWRDIRLLALYIQGDFLGGFRQVEQGGALFFFSHLAWIFFLPRMLTNFGLIYKHVFDESAMTEVERQLGWKRRLCAQLVRRWQEILNDMGWFSSGITNCFFLAGKAPAIGLYLAVAMQTYDLLVMVTRFIIEVRRLNQLRADLLKQRNNRVGRELSQDMELLVDLEERMFFDRCELFYGLFNFLVLLLCAILISFTSNPILPIAAATVAVLITLVTYAMTQWFVCQRQKIYDGELIFSDMRCIKIIKGVTAIPDLDNIKAIDLGIFSAGYMYVLDDKSKLVNIIYVNKRTEKVINFRKTFALTPEQMNELNKILPVVEEGPNRFKILEGNKQQEIIEKLKEWRLDTQDLASVKKSDLWDSLIQRTSKNVSHVSNGILGFGGG